MLQFQPTFFEIVIFQDQNDEILISQRLWVREAWGNNLNPSTLHNSWKQKFYIMKCSKTKLFVQFQFLVNVCTKSLFAQTPSKSNVQQVQLVHTINKIIVFNMKIRNIIRLSYLIQLFLDTSFVFLLRLTMPFHLFESFHSNLLKLC